MMSGLPFTTTQTASNTPQMVTIVDPYVYQTLQSVISREVVIQTVQGNIRGVVTNVLPDHVVLEAGHASFFIRIQQIVWIMPS